MSVIKTTVVVLLETSSLYIPYLDQLNSDQCSPYNYETYLLNSLQDVDIEKCLKYLHTHSIRCVLTISESTCLAAAIINERLGYPSPSPISIVHCLNKYLTRKLVDDFPWFVGFNLEDNVDKWIGDIRTYPCVIKPTMLCYGRGTFQCSNESSLHEKVGAYCSNSGLLMSVKAIQKDMQKVLDLGHSNVDCPEFMVEEFVDTPATQYCMDLLISRSGKVIPYSIVEEIQYKNGMFLGHLQPPRNFNGDFQKFEEFGIEIGKKLFDIGFKNSFFDIEFWRFADGTFKVIEINPRCSTCYFELYKEFIPGVNMLADNTSFFLDDKEPAITPLTKVKEMWPPNADQEYVLLAEIGTQCTGKLSDIFDLNFATKMQSDGTLCAYQSFFSVSPISTLSEAGILGSFMGFFTVKGVWKELVGKERNIRTQLYKHKIPDEEYPDFFTCK